MLVIGLVEEDIFSVVPLCCILLQNALSADTVFLAELFPELVADWSKKTL